MITAIIQARTGSKRLPNKVMLKLCDKPLIWHVFDRLKWSRKIEQMILATTTNIMDDALVKWAKENSILFYRGSENNVLSRYYNAARCFNASTIVRITSDDPFKDPEVIDMVLEKFENNNLDFAYNNKPPTFPEGLDTEVFSYESLIKAHNESVDSFEREHVTQYFYRHPELFKQMNISNKQDLSYLRWTIDTQEDYIMACKVYNNLYKDNQIFLWKDIIELIKNKPEIRKINSTVKQSTMYNNRGI